MKKPAHCAPKKPAPPRLTVRKLYADMARYSRVQAKQSEVLAHLHRHIINLIDQGNDIMATKQELLDSLKQVQASQEKTFNEVVEARDEQKANIDRLTAALEAAQNSGDGDLTELSSAVDAVKAGQDRLDGLNPDKVVIPGEEQPTDPAPADPAADPAVDPNAPPAEPAA